MSNGFFSNIFGTPSTPTQDEYVNVVSGTTGKAYPALLRPGVADNYARQYGTTITDMTSTAVNPFVNQPGLGHSTAGSYIFSDKIQDPNTRPEMQVSLADAHALWAAKFGWEWVASDRLLDEKEFSWRRMAARLFRAQLAEFEAEAGYYKLVPKEWK